MVRTQEIVGFAAGYMYANRNNIPIPRVTKRELVKLIIQSKKKLVNEIV